MTNIFDGHEDKTPEELAKELGISDLSVVDNAGKNAAEVLEIKNSGGNGDEIENTKLSQDNINSPIYTFLGLTESDINDKENWEQVSDRDDFEVGMRVKNTVAAKILDIKEFITIGFDNGKTRKIDPNKEDLGKILAYSDDLEIIIRLGDNILDSEKRWVDEYLISDLERNMRLRKNYLGNQNRWGREEHHIIADIDIKKNTVKVKSNSEIKEFDFLNFYKTFDIYIRDFEPVKIKKLGYEGEWISDYSIEDLKEDMYIKTDENLYKFKDINGKLVSIRGFGNTEVNGNVTYIKDFSDIKGVYQILKKRDSTGKINKFLGINQSDLQNDDLWEEGFDEDEMKIGMRVRKYDGKYGKILNCKRNKFTIKFEDGSKIKFDTFDQFKMEFGIYKLDLARDGDAETLGDDIGKDEEYWHEIQNIKDLAKNMIVSKKSSDKDEEYIENIFPDKIITKNSLGEERGYSYSYFLENFLVYITPEDKIKGKQSSEETIALIFLDEKYINHHDARVYWMEKFDFSDLKIGNRVRTKDSDNKEGGVISDIKGNMIWVTYSDGIREISGFNDFAEKHKLYKPDFAENCWRKDLTTKNTSPICDYKLSDLRKGLEVVDSKTNTWYYIIDIREQLANPNNIDDFDCTIIEIWNRSDDYRSCVFDRDFVAQYILYDEEK